MVFTYEQPKTLVRRTYSDKKLAIEKSFNYSQQEGETIYVYESTVDTNNYEYTLRTRAEVMSLDSPPIVHVEEFKKHGIRFRTHNGLRQVVRD